MEALFILTLLGLNIYIIGVDEKLKEDEIVNRAKSLLKVIKGKHANLNTCTLKTTFEIVV